MVGLSGWVKGDRVDWIDEYLLDLKIIPVIPSTENEDHSAQSVDFEKERYRQRNIIECVIGC